MDSNNSITELEIRLSYLEDLIEKLDSTTTALNQQIQTQQEQLRLMYREINSLQSGNTSQNANEKPPHY